MKIVLATDGSPHAEYAAKLLSQIPHRQPIELTVITTVFVPELSPNAANDAWLPAFKQEQYDTVEQHYNYIAAMFDGVDAQLRHKRGCGHVGLSITEEAKAVGADLIVLGAKGHSAVNRILLGSVSDFVATHAECSVVVVRPGKDESRGTRGVTIAHDGTAESDVAIEQFSLFDWDNSTDGHLLNVVPIVRTFRQELYPSTVIEADQRDQEMESIRRAAEKLGVDEAAAETQSPTKPHFELNVIEAEHVAEAIVQFSEQSGGDLIVVGEHKRGTLGRLMLGSVSRFVLRHASCSVWIARARN